MKPPAEVVGKLSGDEARQVADLEKQIEEHLADHDEWRCNMMETIKTTPEKVWREIVDRADKAGWHAEIEGAIVTIRRPRVR